MVDVNVEFTLGNENPINAEFTLEPDVTYLANIVTATFSGEHNQLIHREYPDQHPIEAITGLTEGLNNLSSAIDDETARAENAENILNGKIDDEISRAILAEGTLQDNIDAEETRAKRVEERLSGLVDSNYQAISNHVADKNNPHEVTKTQVGLGNVENLSPADMPISTATQTALDTKVDKVSTANKVYGTDDSGNQTTYNTDSFGKVDDVRVGGTSVVTNKIANLGTMAGQSAESYSTTAEADALYATAAQGELADTAIQPNDNISLLTNNSNYQTGTQVANAISLETAARENSDNNLQSQIDAITSSSDVTDIVGTYAQLQAYDTSSLPPNSIIKVLQDESRNNETTYYRWVVTGGVGSWVLIGEEGPYYTKSEANSTFVPQTRTVNNKALSNDITLTATDVGALPSSTVIPTVNNATLTIQKNGSTVNTFTANASTNVTANITVPTKTSDITNDSGFITNADLPTNYVTTNTQQNITAIKTFTTDMRFIRGRSDLTTQATSSENWVGPRFVDNNNVQGALVQYRRLSNGVSETNLQTRALSTQNFSKIAIYKNPDGTAFTEAPAPTEDTTSSTQIDTVGARNTKLQNYALSSSLATVATSGSYNDLSNKPTIPTKTSDLTNDSGYITGINSSDVTTALGYTPADDSDVVKTSGNQTIGGIKTFSSYIKATSQVDETSTSTQEKSYIELSDNQATTGYIRQYWSTTQSQLRIRSLSRHGDAVGAWGDIQQIIDINGNYKINVACHGNLVNTALTGATNSSTNGEIPTKGWVNNPDTSTNVVHRNGDETVGGKKTFTLQVTKTNASAGADTPFVNKNTAITKGTAPSANVESRWRLTDSSTEDSNSALVGGVVFGYSTSMRTSAILQAGKPEAGSTTSASMGIYYPATGDPYTSAPTPATSDNSTKIATTAFVKAQGYVDTTSDQTVGGAKTFTGISYWSKAGPIISISNPNISGENWDIRYNTANNIVFLGRVLTGGTWSDGISYRLNTGELSLQAQNGVIAPTPATSDNSTKIATTAYVKAQGYAATRYVDGMVGIARYATSTTAAATVEKVVYIQEITSLEVGQCIIVQPTITSTVADSTIKLNDFIAYPMRYNNAAITTSTDSVVWNQNYPTIWMFDGTYWVFIAHGIDSNTTYSAMSVAEGTTGTATSNRVMRADYLKQILDNRIQLVSSLPATPESNILYCIPES